MFAGAFVSERRTFSNVTSIILLLSQSCQCGHNVGPSSSTLAQHCTNIGWMSRVCWACLPIGTFFSPFSGGSPGPVLPICAQRWPKNPIYYHPLGTVDKSTRFNEHSKHDINHTPGKSSLDMGAAGLFSEKTDILTMSVWNRYTVYGTGLTLRQHRMNTWYFAGLLSSRHAFNEDVRCLNQCLLTAGDGVSMANWGRRRLPAKPLSVFLVSRYF